MLSFPVTEYERNKLSPSFKTQGTKSETPQGLSILPYVYQGCKVGFMLHLPSLSSRVYKSTVQCWKD